MVGFIRKNGIFDKISGFFAIYRKGYYNKQKEQSPQDWRRTVMEEGNAKSLVRRLPIKNRITLMVILISVVPILIISVFSYAKAFISVRQTVRAFAAQTLTSLERSLTNLADPSRLLAGGQEKLPEEVLKRIVLKEIQAYTALFVDYQMIMEELCEMQVSYDQVIGYDTQISKLQEEYNRYYSLKASLGDDLKEGLISKEEFDDFRESYGRKCEELEQMIENQKKLVKQMFEGGVSATVQLEDWKKSLEIKELDRTLLALTVDKIYIYENKQIKIHIRYQDMIEKMKVIRRFYAEHRTECRKEVE